jgi:DNA-binding response OmpR family regulator
VRYPQLVIYESSQRVVHWLREDVQIAEMLRYDEDGQPAAWLGVTMEEAETTKKAKRPRGWLLREPRQGQACLRLLRQGAPSILVIQLRGNGESELALLDQATWLYPDTDVIIVGGEEHRPLVSLALDLGATSVVVPPQAGQQLQALVRSLMQTCAPPDPIKGSQMSDVEE